MFLLSVLFSLVHIIHQKFINNLLFCTAMSDKPIGQTSTGCGLCKALDEDYRLFMSSEHSFAVIIREPQVPFHSLVLPKRHITRLCDFTPEESRDFHCLLEKVMERMDSVLGCSSVCALNGLKFRTQSHIHYQAFPAKAGVRTIMSTHFNVPESSLASKEELSEMADKLRSGKDET